MEFRPHAFTRFRDQLLETQQDLYNKMYFCAHFVVSSNRVSNGLSAKICMLFLFHILTYLVRPSPVIYLLQ